MSEGPTFEGKSLENIEKPSYHYTYVDHSRPNHPVIFECDADSILIADTLYEEKIGEKPEKQNYIGCSVIKN